MRLHTLWATKWFIQVAQVPLVLGFLFHIIMGIVLELKNKSARPVKYASGNKAAGATLMSKSMIYTGLMVMLFLGLHFYDFFIPEIIEKYAHGNWTDATRYYGHLQLQFESPIRTVIYILAFVFLGLHIGTRFPIRFSIRRVQSYTLHSHTKKSRICLCIYRSYPFYGCSIISLLNSIIIVR